MTTAVHRTLQSLPSSPIDVAAMNAFLGAGRVVEATADDVVVEIAGDRRVPARIALAFPYRAEVGDELLVIGRGDEHFVIGVLQGKGRATLAFRGPVDLRADGGPLTLSSDHGVAIRGPHVEIDAARITTIADTVVEKFTSLYQRVRETLSLRAKQTHTVVDDRSILTARTASILTEETMSINGREIHLG